MRIWTVFIMLLAYTCIVNARTDESITTGLEITSETQVSTSEGTTPLWLNANKYGLSSLKSSNGYERLSAIRPAEAVEDKQWKWGYGVDVAVAANYASTLILQQAYGELQWKLWHLTIGAKEQPMVMKNNQLSSGGQTLGINARPIPTLRISIDEYTPLHFLKDKIAVKGHIEYGKTTDSNWQHDFTQYQSSWTDNMLFHSKSGFVKFGNARFDVDAGLEMACQFGGEPYNVRDGNIKKHPTNKNIWSFFHAFVPGGKDARDKKYANAEGNHVGSYLLRMNYHAKDWELSVYADHFFEDHSQMFMMEYNGYEGGEDFHEKKKLKMIMHKFKDIMFGTELKLKSFPYLDNIVLEYLYTKYQSGPYNHDRTSTIPDHYAGKDDYYNNSVYNCWQHWGQVLGNPLYLSPIYNEDGTVAVSNNRFVAYHMGFHGNISTRTDYRVIASWQEGLGTYDAPYALPRHNVSIMAEIRHNQKNDWHIKCAVGMDHGKIMGNNKGVQLTIAKKIKM